VLAVLWCLALVGLVSAVAGAEALTPKERLGKVLFFDAGLSTPPGMSCATCHSPAAGFADPRANSPTSAGAVWGRFGNRNAPSAAYAMGGPQALGLYNGGYAGGTFWDGRVDTLTQQAKLPYLNPLEMSCPKSSYVVLKVLNGPNAALFHQVYGPGGNRPPRNVPWNADWAFNCIADAIAAYERSAEVNPFSSKLDAVHAGLADFTPMERMGMMLFSGKAGCTQCHSPGAVMNQTCAGGCACGCAITGVCKCATCDCGCIAKGETACDGGCMCGCADTGVCTCGDGCQCGCLQTDANACAGGCACGCAFTGVCTCGPMCQCGCPTSPQACAGGCMCGCEWTGVCTCGGDCGCGCPQGGTWNGRPLFTNHNYVNLGVPANPANPFYALPRRFNPAGANFVDWGLGGTLLARGVPGASDQMGKFKVPSLRNVALTAPYMHNGVFADLTTVVNFYNTRDVAGAGWGPPEVAHLNMFRANHFGNLGLTPAEVEAIVAFLETMTDGYTP
jgi:cytochrome c peroxidase